MTSTLIAVFLASLLGSLHCAGMCGAFVTLAVTSPTVNGKPITGARGELARHASYHLGRLSTYAVLGALAGMIGAAIDLGGAAAGLSESARALAAVSLILVGTLTILRTFGVRIAVPATSKGIATVLARGHRVAQTMSPATRAGCIGGLTTLLPCGWLYVFAIVAAGSGGPLSGVAVMLAFWLGTLPVLLSVGFAANRASEALRRRVPVLTALLLIGAGSFAILDRVWHPASADRTGVATLMAAPIERGDTSALRQIEPPCCNPIPNGGTP